MLRCAGEVIADLGVSAQAATMWVGRPGAAAPGARTINEARSGRCGHRRHDEKPDRRTQVGRNLDTGGLRRPRATCGCRRRASEVEEGST